MAPEQFKETRAAIVALEHGGRITPEAVVDAARDPQNPLHKHFEWDDDKAAHQHRLEQARTLIRAVRVVLIVDSQTLATPYYVRDPDRQDHEQGYISIPQLASNAVSARAAILAECERVKSILERVRLIGSALKLDDEVERLLRRLMRFQQQVESADVEGPAPKRPRRKAAKKAAKPKPVRVSARV